MTKVIWSKFAKEELASITKYWNQRNKSTTYSKKIRFHIELAINLIKNDKEIGIKTNVQKVHMRLVLKHFYLIYEIDVNQVVVLRFWDVRQNPVHFKFGSR